MKKAFLLVVVLFIIIFQSKAQFSFSASPGLNLNVPINYVVAQSVSPQLSVNVDYGFKKYFIRTGLMQTAFMTDNGGQVSEFSIPIMIGTRVKSNNFEQLAGVGYYLTFPSQFIDETKQNYFTHSLGAVLEYRFYTSERTFFGFGINTRLEFKTSSSFNLADKTGFYVTYGFNLEKK